MVAVPIYFRARSYSLNTSPASSVTPPPVDSPDGRFVVVIHTVVPASTALKKRLTTLRKVLRKLLSQVIAMPLG